MKHDDERTDFLTTRVLVGEVLPVVRVLSPAKVQCTSILVPRYGSTIWHPFHSTAQQRLGVSREQKISTVANTTRSGFKFWIGSTWRIILNYLYKACIVLFPRMGVSATITMKGSASKQQYRNQVVKNHKKIPSFITIRRPYNLISQNEMSGSPAYWSETCFHHNLEKKVTQSSHHMV